MALGALLLAAVAALAILAPSERSLSPLGALGLIAAFVVAQQVQFEVGIGYTVPSQLVLMPMLSWRRRRSCRCSSRPVC